MMHTSVEVAVTSSLPAPPTMQLSPPVSVIVSRSGLPRMRSCEPLFETGAGSNSGSYSNPTEDSLINETHTNSSLSVFHTYATYTAQQLPYIWMPNEYAVQATASTLHGVTFNPLNTLLPEYWYFTK